MAVKTHFSAGDFTPILAAYDLGELLSFEPIAKGAVQTTYVLVTTSGKYVFRYYENRSSGSVLFESELIQFLRQHDYPCPAIYTHKTGEFAGQYHDKPYLIFEFIEGEHLEHPMAERQRQLIEQVARLQNLTQDYVPAHTDHRLNYSILACRELARNASATINTPNSRAKLAWYEAELAQIVLPESLPKGVCHCDFHFSNILFKDGEFKALIDFDDANYTYLTFDLVTLINPFIPAFEWDTWSNFEPSASVFDFSEARHITREYQHHRELSRTEKDHLYDVFKLSVMFDCIWYFARGDAADFYERRKIDHLNRLGRDNFTRELFS